MPTGVRAVSFVFAGCRLVHGSFECPQDDKGKEGLATTTIVFVRPNPPNMST